MQAAFPGQQRRMLCRLLRRRRRRQLQEGGHAEHAHIVTPMSAQPDSRTRRFLAQACLQPGGLMTCTLPANAFQDNGTMCIAQTISASHIYLFTWHSMCNACSKQATCCTLQSQAKCQHTFSESCMHFSCDMPILAWTYARCCAERRCHAWSAGEHGAAGAVMGGSTAAAGLWAGHPLPGQAACAPSLAHTLQSTGPLTASGGVFAVARLSRGV